MKRFVLKFVGRSITSIRNMNWVKVEYEFWWWTTVILGVLFLAMKFYHDKTSYILFFTIMYAGFESKFSHLKLKNKKTEARLTEIEEFLIKKAENGEIIFNPKTGEIDLNKYKLPPITREYFIPVRQTDIRVTIDK